MKLITIDNYLDPATYSLLLKDIVGAPLANKGVYRKFLDYDPTPKIASLLVQFHEHRNYSKIGKFIHYAVTPPNFKHPVHDEAEFKIMSAIIYLHPKKNHGTTFYLDGEKIEVEWKPNRLMVFCGKTNVTWHDYESDAMRYTYNYFLVDPTKVQNDTYKNHILRM